MKLPELLSPAGDLDRVQTALLYGADAVYLAGRLFGMRAKTVNFQDQDLARAIHLIHAQGKKAYITCNVLPREKELELVPDYFAFLQDLEADALILADLGLLRMAERYAPKCARHVSTQLGVLNSETASFLYELGADTVVLARECSLEEIRAIREHCPAELRLEAFVHGAMCVSFSGRCLLSNYLTGRDANRGECAQPCRWKYALMEEKRPGQYFDISEDGGTFIMNSRDLNMIEHLQDLADAGVTSFKIEGRTKSAYYTAAVTNAYRHAIDAIAERDPVPEIWIRETDMVSHRPYSTGFYFGEPGQVTEGPNYFSGADVMAVVERCDEEGNAVLTQRNKFSRGDTLELLTPEGEPCSFVVERLFNTYGEEIEDAKHAMMELHMRLPKAAPRLSIVRKRR